MSDPVNSAAPGGVDAPLGRAGIARGFAWNSIATIVGKLVLPLASLYIARKLGPIVTGQMSLLAMIIAVSDVLRDGGLTQTYVAEKGEDPQRDREYVGASFLTGLVPAVLILIATPFAAQELKAPYMLYALPLTALVVLVQTATTIPNARLLRKARFRELALINLGVGIGTLVVAILLVARGWGLEALLLQMTIGPFLVAMLMYRLEPFAGVSLSVGPVFARLRASGVLIATNLINNLFVASDVFVVQKLLGEPYTGYYASAFNYGSKPVETVIFPLSRTLMVAFGKYAGDQAKLAEALSRSLAAVAAFVTPLFLFMAIYAEPLILALVGEQFRGSVPVLRLLCIYLGTRAFGNIAGYTLVPLGKHRWTLYPWIGGAAAVVIGLVLIVGRPDVWTELHVTAPALRTARPLGLDLSDAVWKPHVLDLVVRLYVGAAAAVYGTILLLALWLLRPDRSGWIRMARSLACASVSGAWMLTVREATPGPAWAGMLVAIATTPFVHLMVLGTVLARRTFGFMSPSGVRRLWHTL